MRIVSKGASRQDAHERIRVLSHEASAVVKQEGKDNDLISRIKTDPFFAPIHAEIDQLMDSKTFVGRAPEQTVKFVETEVRQALKPFEKDLSSAVSELSV